MITIKKGLVLSLIVLLALFLSTVVVGAAYHDGGYFGTDYDFGGETITFWSWTDDGWERFEEGEVAEGRIEEAEEIFNVNIEFETVSFDIIAETYMDRLLAGDSSHDIWSVENGLGYYDVLAQGGLYPLSDILPEEYYDGLRADTLAPIETMSYQGIKYGFGSTYGIESDFVLTGLYLFFYNKDMIEEAGVPDPYDLYREGNWTYETFSDLARELTVDTTGDGQIDQYALDDQPWIWDSWVYTNNGAIIQEQDGEFIVTLDLPENRETIAQLREWNTIEEIGDGNFTQGTAAFMPHGLWNISGYMDGDSALDFNFGIVPMPRGPSADKNIVPRHALGTTVIPINSVQPEAKVALHEFLFWDDEETVREELQRDLPNWFPEERYAELAIELSRAWDGAGVYIRPGGIQELLRTGGQGWAQHGFTGVIADNIEWSTMVDEVEPQIQAILDDFFDQ